MGSAATAVFTVTLECKQQIAALLHRQHCLSLSTSNQNRPWATNLFYCSDSQFNLYFVSGTHSRHAEDIAENPKVAVTIHESTTDWTQVKGLQMDATASLLNETESAAVLSMYLQKFNKLGQIFNAPSNPEEEKIAQRLEQSRFYRISPRWIRLIDNKQGFSHKQELVITDGNEQVPPI